MPKQKLDKDPNRPKRPTSAYFYFVADQRVIAKKKGEDISRVAIWTKAVSAKWRELTDSQKKPFEAQAVADRARYQTQMQDYTPIGGKRGGKAPKDPNRPKRAPSAYFIFLADFRRDNKSKYTHEGGHKDLIRGAGEAWNKLTDDDKVPYNKKHQEEKKKYEVAIANYTAGGGGSAPKKAKMAPAAAANGDDDDDDDDEEEDEEEDEDSD